MASLGCIWKKKIINKILIKNGTASFLLSCSRYFWGKLKELENKFDIIKEVRGAGLLLGIKTYCDNLEFSEKLKKYRLLNVPAADNTIRLAPPLIVSYKEIDESIAIIKKVLKQYNE